MRFGAPIPILRIFDEAKAREFYLDYLGFTVEFEHRFEPGTPIYLGIRRGDARIDLSEHHGDGSPGTYVRIEVDELEAFHAELTAKRYKYYRPGLVDQEWGLRECAVGDPFHNKLIFYRPIAPRDDAAALIERLDLAPHPEGGHFRETWRDAPAGGGRGAGTAIYFLLRAGEESRWHKVDAAETWHFYRGAPLELEIAGAPPRVLGPDVTAGETPQLVVPAGAWQRARSRGAYTLVGCTVAPAFDFAGFELAPPGWSPPR